MAPTQEQIGAKIARKQEIKAAKEVLTIKFQGAEYKLAINAIPLAEKRAVRKATGGLPFEAFWSGESSVGEDSLAVLVWLARRASGEPDLLLGDVEDAWPSPLGEDDIEISVEGADGDDDDPEA